MGGGEVEKKLNIWRAAAAVAIGITLARVTEGALIPSLIPFFVAYVAARLLRPLGVRISSLLKVSERVGCTAFAVAVCAASAYFLIYASGRIIRLAEWILSRIPTFSESVKDFFSDLGGRFPIFSGGDVLPIISGILEEGAASVGGSIAEALGGIVKGVPGGIAGTGFGIVAFVYLMADLPGASRGIRAILPKDWAPKISRAISDAQSALFAYLRSSLVLMAVTVFVLLVGLWAVRATSPFALALVISFVDALPVLGCGTVLVPWAAWSFAVGEIGRGAGLLVVFLVTYLVRQFLEPRLIGRMTGVHPFVALAAVYAGFRIAGLAGLILAPVSLVFVRCTEEASQEDAARK